MIDVWNYITSFIERDKDKCNLLMTSQELSNCKVFFNEMINLDVINKSKWFHQFTNILTNELSTLPKNLKILNFADRFNGPINNYVPYGVVHLSFGYMFNQSLYECIPSSVTHLEFRDKKINNNVLGKMVMKANILLSFLVRYNPLSNENPVRPDTPNARKKY